MEGVMSGESLPNSALRELGSTESQQRSVPSPTPLPLCGHRLRTVLLATPQAALPTEMVACLACSLHRGPYESSSMAISFTS